MTATPRVSSGERNRERACATGQSHADRASRLRVRAEPRRGSPRSALRLQAADGQTITAARCVQTAATRPYMRLS